MRAALGHVGGPPAVMVGDRVHDVEGARANGIPVIAVGWGIGDVLELSGPMRTSSRRPISRAPWAVARRVERDTHLGVSGGVVL